MELQYKEEYKNKKELRPKWSKEEENYRSFLIDRLLKADNQRNHEYTELDDMSYETYYTENSKAANAYIRPKDNAEDKRITTGTTLEKEATLLSSILNYDITPMIFSYNEINQEIFGFGDKLQDLIKKSRELEEYDEIKGLIYKEGYDQGTCFVEEICQKKYVNEKQIKSELKNLEKLKWKNETVYKGNELKTNLFSGLKIYLGNFREFFIQKQPYIFTVDLMSRAQAEVIFGQFDKWKYVPKKVSKFVPETFGYTEYMDFTMQEIEQDCVEIVKYYDKWVNEYQIMLNGVMMLPVGFPLTVVSPSGEYPMGKLDVAPISRYFALSKSVPAKTKVDQQVLDHFLRMMILKMEKSFNPPMANNTNRILSKNIFYPRTIHNNIDPSKLQPIGDVNGLSNAEFNIFSFIKKIIDDKSISPLYSGQSVSGTQSATEIMELKKQNLMRIGQSVLGVIMFEKQMSNLRLYNLLQNWTEPMSEKFDEVKKAMKPIFMTQSVESTDENGESVTNVYEFNEEAANTKTPEQIDAENKIMSGIKKRKKIYLNPKAIKEFKGSFYIKMNIQEKDKGDLDRMLFTQSVGEGFNLFTPQAFNMAYLKEQWAIKNKLDPSKLFVQQQPIQPMTGEEGENGANSGATSSSSMSQMPEGIKQAVTNPSLKAMAMS